MRTKYKYPTANLDVDREYSDHGFFAVKVSRTGVDAALASLRRGEKNNELACRNNNKTKIQNRIFPT